MRIDVDVITGPQEEPLTVPEVRMHLRQPEISSNDAEIVWFIQAAREMVQNKLSRSLLTQTREATLDRFPSYCEGNAIELPFPPLQSVTSVKYMDESQVEQTLASTEYSVDATGRRGRLLLGYGKSWPSTLCNPGAVKVRYVAGWTNAAQVPQAIKQYMRGLIAATNGHRSLLQEKEMFLTPYMERLLDEWRILGV